MVLKRYLLLLCLCVFAVNEICSQITRDAAYVRLQTVVLDGNWEDKDIASKSVTVQPTDTIRTVDSFVVAPQFESWLFFVDEFPAAN